MMNSMESSGVAKLCYLDGDLEIQKPDTYVLCSVTSGPIAVDMVRYWSVSRQEAYASAASSLKREIEMNSKLAPSSPAANQ